MICPHCSSQLPRRPRARAIMTGSLLIAAAIVLLLFVHLPVIVLAAVLLAVTGASMVRGTRSAMRCPNCGRRP